MGINSALGQKSVGPKKPQGNSNPHGPQGSNKHHGPHGKQVSIMGAGHRKNRPMSLQNSLSFAPRFLYASRFLDTDHICAILFIQATPPYVGRILYQTPPVSPPFNSGGGVLLQHSRISIAAAQGTIPCSHAQPAEVLKGGLGAFSLPNPPSDSGGSVPQQTGGTSLVAVEGGELRPPVQPSSATTVTL
ncbi:hypothetical protein PIB30_067943 [Stylosanthes scabra]|uniref:Uncharacterized protein n=1 Tax=Stylosanthes scabra TaxID=79078 RepID=A0ABU6VL58_9FABA|nr:hypothetical protein [Stylosanthes scabra]